MQISIKGLISIIITYCCRMCTMEMAHKRYLKGTTQWVSPFLLCSWPFFFMPEQKSWNVAMILLHFDDFGCVVAYSFISFSCYMFVFLRFTLYSFIKYCNVPLQCISRKTYPVSFQIYIHVFSVLVVETRICNYSSLLAFLFCLSITIVGMLFK